MADEERLNQDEIEEMLRQAQQSGAGAPPPGEPPPSEGAPEIVGADASHTAPGAARAGLGDDINYLLSQAEEAIASVDNPHAPDLSNLAPFQFQDLSAASPPSTDKATIELLRDVELDVKIELGRTHLLLEDVLKLRRGSVVPLDKLAGDPVDIYVNGRLIARGEVLVLNDNFCVRVAELMSGDDVEY